MHVLLVEDSQTLQNELSSYILNAGYEVTAAKDGETAVQIMELNSIDLIICDVEMPGLNGYETVSIIREALGEYWLPILFLTKRNTVADFLKGIEVGADDYLLKPINEKVLHAKMKVMERFIIMQQQLNEALNAHEKAKKFDPLTQVYSKTHFNDLAKLQWNVLARQKQPASILVIAIDYLQEHTEFYDEKATDAVIRSVAHKIRTAIHRPGDFVGRIEQNLFVMMLPETSKSGCEKVSERIVESVESLNIEHKKSRALGVASVSVGGQSVINLKTNQLSDAIKVAQHNLATVQAANGHDYLVTKKSELINSGVELNS